MACMCGVCMWYVYGRLSSRFVYPWSSFSTRRTISGPTRIVIRSAPPRSPLLVARFRFCPAAAGSAASTRFLLFVSPDTIPGRSTLFCARLGLPSSLTA